MKKLVFIIFTTIILSNIVAQEINYNKDNYFTIVSYNVENLYDTIDDPGKDDNEFLPQGKNAWESDKYQKKIKNLAQVISSINKNELPELVGLVEIENISVITDLINYKFLNSGNYGIVHHDSPDARGIDVALIYRKDEFRVIEEKALNVFYDFEPATKTRDILYVKGKLNNNEILHVFVNHWSSRREGEEISEPKRLYTAGILKTKTDEILRIEKNAKIIIMGDFNDEPTSKSLKDVLKASNKYDKGNWLYNLMYDKHLLGYGTYDYRGNWNMLDNLIISQALIYSPSKYQVSFDGGQIFNARWMMYDNAKTGELIPNKTYNGSKYLGGYSDHLPIYMILKK